MKTKNTLASIVLAGAMAFTGCNHETNNEQKSDSERQPTIFVTTAEKVVIEPHYSDNKIYIDGIVMKRFAYGNGSQVPNIEDSIVYKKGSPEYEALHPLLTVEREY
ncbi:MAG: hypothetical protein WDZ77_02330 [Candidatus Pacearchaeota archaeon]